MAGAFVMGTNAPATSSGSVGSGTVGVEQPFLMKDTAGTVVSVTDGKTARSFAGGTTPSFYLEDTLSYDSMAGEYTLTDPTGQVFVYEDFDTGLPAAQRGQLTLSLRTSAGWSLALTARPS